MKEGEQKGTERLVYLLDNCGEIVLDKLVIRILKEQYPHLKITAVVRGTQVINDATKEDADSIFIISSCANVTGS